jgi:hypothetical protein
MTSPKQETHEDSSARFLGNFDKGRKGNFEKYLWTYCGYGPQQSYMLMYSKASEMVSG